MHVEMNMCGKGWIVGVKEGNIYDFLRDLTNVALSGILEGPKECRGGRKQSYGSSINMWIIMGTRRLMKMRMKRMELKPQRLKLKVEMPEMAERLTFRHFSLPRERSEGS